MINFGPCPYCQQGLLKVIQTKQTQAYLICCEECDTCYKKPSHINTDLVFVYNVDIYGSSRYATMNEIIDLGWDDDK